MPIQTHDWTAHSSRYNITNRTSSASVAEVALKMDTPNYGLDYSKCTTEELIAFREERRGVADEPKLKAPEKPKKGKKKPKAKQAAENRRSRVIKDLHDMDADWTFRFMDLPAEMRNLVYVELLSRDKENSRQAFLNILHVSKQVEREAAGVLVAESVISIQLRFQYTQPTPAQARLSRLSRKGTFDTQEYGERVKTYGDFATELTLDEMTHEYAKFNRLSKARSLDIELSMWTNGYTKGDTLAIFFDMIAKNFTKLTKLRIKCQNLSRYLLRSEYPAYIQASDQDRIEEAAKLLARLSVFPKTVTLELEGLDDEIYEAVWKKINETGDVEEGS